MATFTIILDQPRPELSAALALKYPDHRKLNDHAYFLKANSTAVALSQELLTPNGITNGVVIFRVTADYYGYSKTDFWDWVARSFVEGDSG